jgi:hypothetical protein
MNAFQIRSALSNLWSGLFGIPKIGSYKSLKENVDEDILLTGKGHFAVEIDLMQPIDASKSPKVHFAFHDFGLTTTSNMRTNQRF